MDGSSTSFTAQCVTLSGDQNEVFEYLVKVELLQNFSKITI